MAKSSEARDERVAKRVEENLKKKGSGKVKAKTGKSEKSNGKTKAKFEVNEKGIRKGTVMETIFNGLKRGATQKEILADCVKAHKDRKPDAMEKTVKLQIFRMPKERGLILSKKKVEGSNETRYKITGYKEPERPSKAEKSTKGKIKDKNKKTKKVVADEAEEDETEEEEEEEETEEASDDEAEEEEEESDDDEE